ncbi:MULTISPECIES: DUF202 domain-containing protein [Serratia]|uniref:DUF202 domain-containing protein n=1 Tax=Serratia TaxID=613 RepID=UPI000668EC64|nr:MULTISPECIES: DUF202 domain-containing protein [Serratia]
MHSTVETPPCDPGLQPERTRLAWGRTALTMAVVGLLSLRAGMVSGSLLLAGSGFLMLAFALAMFVWSRGREATGPEAQERRLQWVRRIFCCLMAVMLLAAVAQLKLYLL